MRRTVVTHAPTEANRANLAASFLAEVQARYAGHAAGAAGAGRACCWRMSRARCGRRPRWRRPGGRGAEAGPDRGGGGPAGDGARRQRTSAGSWWRACVCAGPPQDWRGYVLEDASVRGGAARTGRAAAIAAMERHGADRLVAEVNQGGDLVETVMRQVDPLVPFRAVRAGARQGGAGGAGGGALRAGAGAASARAGRAGGPDVPDDGARVRGAGIAGPGGCAGLGDARADDRAGGELAGGRGCGRCRVGAGALPADPADICGDEERGCPVGRPLSVWQDRMRAHGRAVVWARERGRATAAAPRCPRGRRSATGRVVALAAGAGRVVWSPRDTASLTRAGFTGNPVGFPGGQADRRGGGGAAAGLSGRERRVMTTHPVLDLLRRPNPGQGRAELFEALFGQLLLSGNGYVEAVGSARGAAGASCTCCGRTG